MGQFRQTMLSMKYRSIKTPPACTNISLKDAMESARTVAEKAGSGRFVAARSNGRLTTTPMAGDTLTQSRPKTSSGAVGKQKKSTSKS